MIAAANRAGSACAPGFPAGRADRVIRAAFICLLLVGTAAGANIEIGPPAGKSQVPPWDARGLGPLPAQGVACADMTDDGRFVAIGTIAPPGDWHAFLLDENGKIVEQYRAGERWINAVAVGDKGSFLAAFCTTPAGKASDRPIVKLFCRGSEVPKVDEELTTARGEGDRFDYGDNSNHCTQRFAAIGETLVMASQGKCGYLNPGAGPKTPTVSYGSAGAATLMGLTVSAGGRAVVALAVRKGDRAPQSRGLVVIDTGKCSILWSRPVSDDAEAPPAFARGAYGPAGGPYEDNPVWAPLSVAIDPAGKLVAAADYRGWNRNFDRGLNDKEDFGMHFVPTRPTIQVYEAEGKPVRRFGPETFAEPFWCDLRFSADGKRLLVFPHNWTSRGLGGAGILPADPNARSVYVLNIPDGSVDVVRFPDAVSSLAVAPDGGTVVGCWDHRVYILDVGMRPIQALPQGLDVGAAGLVRVSRDGSRILVAGADGVVRMLDAQGKERWRNDLNKSVPPGEKPWTRNQKLGQIAPGVWCKNGQRTHSDMGSQYVIEAPDGLILIEANGGLSIEQTWAQILAANLDPMKVRYVLITHDHGDHAPGSYLWRLITGAQVVASPETACILRHHTPVCGYGFHPPQPVDVTVGEDRDLTLAGLKIRVLRLPGHTYGSLGFAFEKEGRKYVATGDLIMPNGVLGYSGSLDFSAKDVLASLRKLDALRPDVVLGGHGRGEPGEFIAKGIAAGVATGWGRMTPEKPDPFHSFTQKNYLVVAWPERIASAAYGDIDGDGLPDVAVLTQDPNGAQVEAYLNRKGGFAQKPDLVQPVSPPVTRNPHLRLVRLSRGKVADLLIAGEAHAVLLLSQDGKGAYRAVEFPGLQRASHVLVGDFNGDGRADLLLGQRFADCFSLALQSADGTFRVQRSKAKVRSYFDLQLIDLNGDGREDLILSSGDIFLRQADGTLPDEPSIRLDAPPGGWTFMAAADFNADKSPDVVLLSKAEKEPMNVWVYHNTRDPRQPFPQKPDAAFVLPDATILRDGPTIGDWNGDGRCDLVLTCPEGALILLSSPQGLSPQRTARVKLDYRPHHDTRLGVADFNGDGKTDLAGWGPSATGALGVYVWLQP